MKTNAARLLDGLGIRYRLQEYDVDPDHASAEEVAPADFVRAARATLADIARSKPTG